MLTKENKEQRAKGPVETFYEAWADQYSFMFREGKEDVVSSFSEIGREYDEKVVQH